MSLLQPGSERNQRITSIQQNDVLLGRGNHVHNPGNEKFRSRVRARSEEYWSCSDNAVKDSIARQIIDDVVSQKGRFLRKVKIHPPRNVVILSSSDGGATPDTTTPFEYWEIPDMETILIKVKQTFRDFSASNRKRAAASIVGKKPTPSSSNSKAEAQEISDIPKKGSDVDHPKISSDFPSLPSALLLDNINNDAAVSLPVPVNTQESLFQNVLASQLDHLAHNEQQQLHRKNAEDRHVQLLFEQQRAILMAQLQQPSVESQLTRHLVSGQLLQVRNDTQDPQVLDPQHALLLQVFKNQQRLLELDRFGLDTVQAQPSTNPISFSDQMLLRNLNMISSIQNSSQVLPQSNAVHASHIHPANTNRFAVDNVDRQSQSAQNYYSLLLNQNNLMASYPSTEVTYTSSPSNNNFHNILDDVAMFNLYSQRNIQHSPILTPHESITNTNINYVDANMIETSRLLHSNNFMPPMHYPNHIFNNNNTGSNNNIAMPNVDLNTQRLRIIPDTNTNSNNVGDDNDTDDDAKPPGKNQ
jgi:hypothetical protein